MDFNGKMAVIQQLLEAYNQKAQAQGENTSVDPILIKLRLWEAGHTSVEALEGLDTKAWLGFGLPQEIAEQIMQTMRNTEAAPVSSGESHDLNKLEKVLLRAFPRENDLDEVVRGTWGMSESLSTITKPGNLRQRTQGMLHRAQNEGQLTKLLLAARQANSTNRELIAYEQAWRVGNPKTYDALELFRFQRKLLEKLEVSSCSSPLAFATTLEILALQQGFSFVGSEAAPNEENMKRFLEAANQYKKVESILYQVLGRYPDPRYL